MVEKYTNLSSKVLKRRVLFIPTQTTKPRRGRSTLAQPKTIWYVNKYASPPGANGGLRGVSLASKFVESGHAAIVINSRANHQITQPPEISKKVFGSFALGEHWGVATYTHQTIRYGATASAKRVLSWLHFEIGLIALPVRKLPTPTHIIVSSLSLLTVLNGHRFAKKFDAKLIFEIRDIWPLTLTAESSLTNRNPLVRVLSWIERFGYRNADVVVGTMPNLVEHVHAVSGACVRVETIGLGIDPDLEAVTRLPPVRRSNAQFRVVYAGSIGRSNSLHRLLAVAESFTSEEGLTFEFFGKGDYLEKLQQKYFDEPHILFRGSLPRPELLKTLRTADVFFLAAEDSEIWKYGQSLHKVVEYMALGRPIVAAYSGFPSMIDEASCGVFVPSDDVDALRQQILAFKGMTVTELNALGERGKTWILEHRTYAKLAEKYLEILDSL